jgi:hypothetical protein
VQNIATRNGEQFTEDSLMRESALIFNYSPKPLAVRIVYFSAEYDATPWRRISPDLEVIKLHGNHLAMIIDPTDLALHLKALLQTIT